MAEQEQGPKIPRRKLLFSGAISALGSILSSCLPHDQKLLDKMTSQQKERVLLPPTDEERRAKEAIEKIKKQEQEKLEIEKQREKLEESIRALTVLPLEVNPIYPNDAMNTIQIDSPQQMFLRNLPVVDRKTETGDFIPSGTIIQNILFSVSYRGPERNNEISTWAVTRPDLLSQYSFINMKDPNKALAVGNQRYVFFCLQEGETKYFQLARTKP